MGYSAKVSNVPVHGQWLQFISFRNLSEQTELCSGMGPGIDRGDDVIITSFLIQLNSTIYGPG